MPNCKDQVMAGTLACQRKVRTAEQRVLHEIFGFPKAKCKISLCERQLEQQ